MSKNTGVNAKNIEFDRPGAGIEGYGITPQNLNAKLLKLYGARTEKEGGSKQIWDAMVKNTSKSLARSPDSLTSQQFNQFLSSGKLPDKPTAGFQKYAAESLDYGLRETGRAQQHKPTDFLSGFLTDMLPEIALGFVPGVGPALAAAYGGIKGGVDSGSVLGGITGALSGYGAGGFGAGLSSAGSAAGGVSGFMDNPAQWAANLGSNAVSGITNGVKGAFDSFGNFIEHPIDSLTGVASAGGRLIDGATGHVISGGSELDNINGLFGPEVANRAVTGAGSLVGNTATAASNAARAAASGGGSTLGSLVNLAGNVAPIIGGIQAAGAAKDAANAQRQASNNAIAEQRRQFDTTQANLAPYLAAGKATLPVMLNDLGVGKATNVRTYGSLIKPFTGASLANEPGYKFELAQGEQGINRAASAAGRYDSGAVLKALSRFNTDYAGTKYNEAFNRDSVNKTDIYNKLAGVTGTGQATANQLAVTGASNANAISDLLTGAGNARAAGIVGSSNAINNGITSAFNNYQQNRLLSLLTNGGSGNNYSWGP